jgi:hypothetical protein
LKFYVYVLGTESKAVCGTDHVTYSSDCELRRQSCITQSNTQIAHYGYCGKFNFLTSIFNCFGSYAQIFDWLVYPSFFSKVNILLK